MSDVAIVKYQSFAATIVSNDYHGQTHKDIQPWFCKEFKEMLMQNNNEKSLGSPM